jgi:hypothetical protein
LEGLGCGAHGMKSVTRQWVLLITGLIIISFWIHAYYFSPRIAYRGPSRMHITEARARKLSQALEAFKNDFDNYPTGDNATISKQLLKGNPKGKVFLDTDRRSLFAMNEKSEYVDAWGNPFQIEMLITNSLVLRSAGIDRVFGTKDDLVFEQINNSFVIR